MKKSLVLAVAAASVMAFAAPAFAAPVNPFADVRADHWAYEAVTGLYKSGLVSGNEGKFMGTNAMTRYEMAQVVYAAMQKMEKATPDQKAAIEKLQKEFASELKGLGARVAKLEAGQKAPSVIIMGQQRFTASYRKDDKANATWGFNDGRKGYVTYRTRLEWYAPFGKDFTYFGRLRAQDYDVTRGTTATGAGSFAQVKMEQHWLAWNTPFNFKDTKLTVGRQGLFVGKGGLLMAVGDWDLVKLDTKLGKKVNYTFMYGGAGDQVGTPTAPGAGSHIINQISFKPTKDIGLVAYNFRKNWGRTDFKPNVGAVGQDFNLWAVGVDAKINKKLSFFGEYARNTKDLTKGAWHDNVTVAVPGFGNVVIPAGNWAANANQKKNPQAYWFGVTNGSTIAHPGMALMVPFTKQGASAFAVIYKKIENGATPLAANQLNAILGNSGPLTAGCMWLTDNVKGFEAYYEKVLRPNVVFLGQFGSMKPINESFGNVEKTNYAVGQLYLFF